MRDAPDHRQTGIEVLQLFQMLHRDKDERDGTDESRNHSGENLTLATSRNL